MFQPTRLAYGNGTTSQQLDATIDAWSSEEVKVVKPLIVTLEGVQALAKKGDLISFSGDVPAIDIPDGGWEMLHHELSLVEIDPDYDDGEMTLLGAIQMEPDSIHFALTIEARGDYWEPEDEALEIQALYTTILYNKETRESYHERYYSPIYKLDVIWNWGESSIVKGAPFETARLDSVGLSYVSEVRIVNSEIYVLGLIGGKELALVKSTDGGFTYSAPVIIYSPGNSSTYPQDDDQKNYTGSERIGVRAMYHGVAMSISDKMVYAVWAYGEQGDISLLFRKSIDGGRTFEKVPTAIEDELSEVVDLKILASGTDIYLAWINAGDKDGSLDQSLPEGDLVFVRSTDGGESFDIKTHLDENAAGPIITAESANLDQNRDNPVLYLAWQSHSSASSMDTYNDELSRPVSYVQKFQRSLDGGKTFEDVPGTLRSDESPLILDLVVRPETVDDVGSTGGGTSLYLLGRLVGQTDNDSNQFLFAKSSDDGDTFDHISHLNIDGRQDDSISPSMLVLDKVVYLAWLESQVSRTEHGAVSEEEVQDGDFANGTGDLQDTNFDKIVFARSIDAGQTFSEKAILALSTGDGYFDPPQLISSNNDVHVVWTENSANEYRNNGDLGIYHAMSADLGETFSQSMLVNKIGRSESFAHLRNAFALPNGNVYIIWNSAIGDLISMISKKG